MSNKQASVATQQENQPPSSINNAETVSIAPQIEVARVGVRVPPFWIEKPGLWFAQLEAQFALANITADTTKYYTIIGQLEPRYLTEVEDIINDPPADGKYLKLKAELIKRLSASSELKVKQLITEAELGDRKPSQFLRHLKSLAGPDVPDQFIKTIWASRLPQNTQQIIASQTTVLASEKLAEMADKIHEITPAYPQIAAASHNSPLISSGTNSALDNMAKSIEELTHQISALTAHNYRGRTRGRFYERSRNRSPSAGRNSERSHSSYRDQPLCYYHARFGSKARRCIKPCDFSSRSGNAPGN